MKKIGILLIVAMFAASCACQKKSATPPTATLVSGCPTDGSCTIKVDDNRTVILRKDEYGSGFCDLSEAKGERVVTIRYEKRVPKGIQDGFYNEELLLVFSDDLQPQLRKAVYGRFCYCKGETGYYELPLSALDVSTSGEETRVVFKVSEVRQVLAEVVFRLK